MIVYRRKAWLLGAALFAAHPFTVAVSLDPR